MDPLNFGIVSLAYTTIHILDWDKLHIEKSESKVVGSDLYINHIGTTDDMWQLQIVHNPC